MVYNKIYAQIGEERHIVLDPINYQYDVKQILVISGETVPEYYEADICNVGDTATLTMIGTAADGVEIPDRFLLDGRNVLVYVVIPGSGGDVQTRYDITIPVDERAEREDIDPSEAEQQQIDSLIAALNSGVGRAEAAVTHYPKIVDGYWYVWNSETETWVNTGIRAEGRDGYSPEVTITEIEGGHRVTITDEDHPQGQTFDVMDGQGGGTGDYDELTNRPRINGHTLTGNQSAADLGLGTYSKPADGIPKTDLAQDVQQSIRKADTALQTAPVQSVAGKTGAVNLGAGDVGFNSSEEYNDGTVGAELSELNRQLSDKQDAPATDGTAGQVLALDDNLNPVWADQSGGGGGTSDYTELENKPQINGHTLDGNQSASDLGLGTYSKPASGIPKTDLASAVQTSLGKADSAYQKPAGGIPATDLASAVQTSLGKADSALQTAPVSSVAGKTGAVTLDAGDVEFDDTETYAAGSVGAELSSQLNAISQKEDALSIVQKTSSDVTITLEEDKFYIFPTMTELTVTCPLTGLYGFRFTSGTTPTVFLMSGITMPDNWNGTEASKTYDMTILNGLALVTSWSV